MDRGELLFWAAFAGLMAVGALFRAIEWLNERREKLRDSDPERYLQIWAARNDVPPRIATVQLNTRCPRCREPTYGVPIPAHQLSLPPLPAAWRCCRKCGLEEPVFAKHPWTKEQADQQLAAEERQARLTEEREIIQRELERRRKEKISRLEDLLSMTGAQFERAVAEILEANGFSETEVVGGSGDLTVDVICKDPQGKPLAVQCKRYQDKPIGSRELQTFIGMINVHHRIAAGMYVTTSRYTAPAQVLAKQHKIRLVDRKGLLNMAKALEPQEAPVDIEKLEAWSIMQKEAQRAQQRRRKTNLDREEERRRRARHYARLNAQLNATQRNRRT